MLVFRVISSFQSGFPLQMLIVEEMDLRCSLLVFESVSLYQVVIVVDFSLHKLFRLSCVGLL